MRLIPVSQLWHGNRYFVLAGLNLGLPEG